MATAAELDLSQRDALAASRQALRRVAGYQLDPAWDERLRELGERKESLTPAEHLEWLALVAFAQQRTLEKLEAELALRRLDEAWPHE